MKECIMQLALSLVLVGLPCTNAGNAFTPRSRDELQSAVDKWQTNSSEAALEYGHIADWNTSLITDFSYLFTEARAFDADLSKWDTSHVTVMKYMFYGAAAFNGDISTWNTSSVTDMFAMFSGATAFNGNISRWSTGRVATMEYMFQDAARFNGDISKWNTASVVSMASMFADASSFNGDLSQWNTSCVTNMHRMFYGASSFNGEVGQWNTSSVTTMHAMFKGARTFNASLSSWDTSRVTDMGSMFDGATSFNADISSWNTAEVRSLQAMFHKASLFNGDISRWNVGKVTNMQGMFFAAAKFNSDISGWNTSSVQRMDSLFLRAPVFNGNLSRWNTCRVESMHATFADTGVFNGDLSSWCMDKVVDVSEMFMGARAFNRSISQWNTASVLDMNSMFYGAVAFNQDLWQWNTSSVRDMQRMFVDATAFQGDISEWDTGRVEDMRMMFYGATAFNGNISHWDTSSVTKMSSMFQGASAFAGDLSRWDTSSVKDMSEMFREAVTFNSDISEWDTGKVTDMSYMFAGAVMFNANLSTWNTTSAVDMSSMFLNAEAFDCDLSVSWKPMSLTWLGANRLCCCNSPGYVNGNWDMWPSVPSCKGDCYRQLHPSPPPVAGHSGYGPRDDIRFVAAALGTTSLAIIIANVALRCWSWRRHRGASDAMKDLCSRAPLLAAEQHDSLLEPEHDSFRDAMKDLRTGATPVAAEQHDSLLEPEHDSYRDAMKDLCSGAPPLAAEEHDSLLEPEHDSCLELSHWWLEDVKGDQVDVNFDSLHDRLGKGGFGEVWRGTLRRRHGQVETVAVKRLSARTEFEREVRALRDYQLLGGVCHSSIVRLLAVDIERCWIITEYCSHGSLVEWMLARRHGERTSEDLQKRLTILCQVAAALAWLASCGVVHCDVQPSNILLADSPHGTGTLTAKLSDFCLAHEPSKCTRHTSRGVGTRMYMAPELLCPSNACPHSEKSDVWSFTLVTYAALIQGTDITLASFGLAGAHGSNLDVALREAIRRGEHPAVDVQTIISTSVMLRMEQLGEDLRRALSERLSAMLARGFSMDPSERPTCNHMAKILFGLQRMLSGHDSLLEAEIDSCLWRNTVDLRQLQRDVVLADGRFGKVWRGILEEVDGSKAPAAIKGMKPTFWNSYEHEAKMLEKALLPGGSCHRHIVKLMAANIGNRWLVYELCTDGDMLNLVERGFKDTRESLLQRLGLLQQIACALEWLAQPEVRVVHCDVHLRHILLAGDTAKLCDFVLAHRVDEPGTCGIQQGFSHVCTGAYAAPEVLSAKKHSACPHCSKSDIWSFAVVSFALLQGAEIDASHFDRECVEQVSIQGMSALSPLSNRMRIGVANHLSQILKESLATPVSQRPASREVNHALLALMGMIREDNEELFPAV